MRNFKTNFKVFMPSSVSFCSKASFLHPDNFFSPSSLDRKMSVLLMFDYLISMFLLSLLGTILITIRFYQLIFGIENIYTDLQSIHEFLIYFSKIMFSCESRSEHELRLFLLYLYKTNIHLRSKPVIRMADDVTRGAISREQGCGRQRTGPSFKQLTDIRLVKLKKVTVSLWSCTRA